MPILSTDGLSGLSEVASAAYLLSLADRNPLVNHPALFYVGGDRVGEGSINVELSEFDILGTDLPTAIAESASVGDTSITKVDYTVTVGRYSKAYSRSDLARITDAKGVLDPMLLAQDAALAHALKLKGLISALGSGWTAVAGTSGAALTASDFIDARNTLAEAKNSGPILAILKPKQWNQVLKNIAITLSTGALIREPSVLDPMQAFPVLGYQGRWMGVDVFTSDDVPDDSTDYAGQMIATGAVLWGDAAPPVDSGADQMIVGNRVLFERDRTARAAVTAYVSHSYMGVTRGLQARGVRIRSGV